MRRVAATICADWVTDAPTEVSLVITDDAGIRQLNQRWRGKDASTDVLSFPQFDPPVPRSAPCLGDVVISLETAVRQARDAGHGLSDEMIILLVHGLLHLLGCDHMESGEREQMDVLERAWLRRFRVNKGLVQRAGGT